MPNQFDKIKDPQSLLFEMRKRKKDLLFWVIGIIAIIFIWVFISNKDYSFLLVLSSLIQSLGFLIVAIKVYSYQNTSGLSINTLFCYAILLSGRLSSTIFFYGYLPSDASGDWFYQLTDFFSLFLVILLIYFITKVYRETSDLMNDSVSYYYLVIPSICLALLVHTSLNNFFLTDVLWTFSMYLEAVAVFPQIKLFVMKKGQIEPYTSHYVALCGLSRLFSLIFWFDTFRELNDSSNHSFSFFSHYCGYFIIISQIIQLIIMGDYYYLYFKSFFQGTKMTLNDI